MDSIYRFCKFHNIDEPITSFSKLKTDDTKYNLWCDIARNEFDNKIIICPNCGKEMKRKSLYSHNTKNHPPKIKLTLKNKILFNCSNLRKIIEKYNYSENNPEDDKLFWKNLNCYRKFYNILPEIEKYFHVNIHYSSYKTNHTFIKNLYLNGSFSDLEIKQNYMRLPVINPCFGNNERQLCICDTKNNPIKCYTIDNYFEIDECIQLKSMNYFYYSLKNMERIFPNLSPHDICKKIINYSKHLLEISHGKINLFKTGSFNNTIKCLISLSIKGIVPENIEENEVELLNNASTGQYVLEKEFTSPTYHYDQNCSYPYFLQSSSLFIPTSPPISKKIIDFETNLKNHSLPYGIYKCKIENETIMTRVFKSKKYFTHWDLYIIHSEKIKIHLEEDTYYSYDTGFSGHYLFGDYVNEIYELKIKYGSQNPLIKLLLSPLWGVLCQQKKPKSITIPIDEIPNTQFDCENSTIISNIDSWKIIYDKYKYFETRLARFKPFLISLQKWYIYQEYKKHEDTIMAIYTDSFFSSKKIEEYENDNNTLGVMRRDKNDYISNRIFKNKHYNIIFDDPS